MSNHIKYLLLLLISVLFSCLYAEEKEATPLLMQQERIQQLIIKLDEKFISLAENLKEKEPENAKLLLAAFKRSKETLVQLKVESSIKLLKDQDLEKAIDSQQKIIEDLFNILNALTNLDFSNKDEIKRLEELKKKIEKLIKDEYKIKNESTKLEDKKQSLEKYAEEILKLEALIKDSEDTLQKTVENRVKGLSHLSGIAKNIERQSKVTEQIYEKIAGYPLTDKNNLPQEKPEDQKALDDPSSKNENEKKLMEPGTNELKKSFDFFGIAEKGIMDGKPFSSEKSQKDAIESLKNALKELQNEKDRILSLPENYADELAKNQDKVRDDVEKLKNEKEQNKLNPTEEGKNAEGKGEGEKGEKGEDGEKGEGKGEKGEGEKAEGENGEGEQGEGEKGEGEQNGENKPKDSKQAQKSNPFEKTKKFMEESSKNLKEKQISKAKENQDKSIKELKKIKEEIDKTLAQLRSEEKEEKLAGLENRFIEILQRERTVKEQTVFLEQFKLKSEWTRNEKIKCVNLMHEQNALKELVVRAEDILMEDASTIVFPDIVNQLKDDMSLVTESLKSENTGKITQAMESEIIQTLEEMVEALQKAREDAKKDAQSGGGGGGGGSDPNQLISESQELKLLRKMQLRVNRMTKLFTEEAKNNDLPEAKKDLKRVHDKQKQVLEITRKINERKQQ